MLRTYAEGLIQIRGYQYCPINNWPLHYIPSNDDVYFDKQVRATLSFEELANEIAKSNNEVDECRRRRRRQRHSSSAFPCPPFYFVTTVLSCILYHLAYWLQTYCIMRPTLLEPFPLFLLCLPMSFLVGSTNAFALVPQNDRCVRIYWNMLQVLYFEILLADWLSHSSLF